MAISEITMTVLTVAVFSKVTSDVIGITVWTKVTGVKTGKLNFDPCDLQNWVKSQKLMIYRVSLSASHVIKSWRKSNL